MTQDYGHAEGYQTLVNGIAGHAEGQLTTASNYSHAEGLGTTAGNGLAGLYSHAEGAATTTLGIGSHAEGNSTTAIGSYSHAEGYNTVALGNYSHAGGKNTVASASYQTVVGIHNTQGDITSLFAVGNGDLLGTQKSTAFRIISQGPNSGSMVTQVATNTIAEPSWTGVDGEMVPVF